MSELAESGRGEITMATIYKVGKKWRADWTDNDGVRHRQRFNTKGEADAHLDSIRASFSPAPMLRHKGAGCSVRSLIHGLKAGLRRCVRPAPVVDRQASCSDKVTLRT